MANDPENNQSYSANPNQKVYDTPHQVDHLVDVLDIYFADERKKFKWVQKEETYTVKKGGKIVDVKNIYTKKFADEKKTTRNLATDPDHTNPLNPNDQIKITWEEQQENGVELVKISKVHYAKKVHVVAKCNGQSGKLSIEINENKLANPEAVFDSPVKFLIGEEEKTKIEFTISRDKTEYSQEITLKPKSEDDHKKIAANFDKRTEKKAHLFFKADVTETQDEIKFPDETNEFLNKDKERLEVSGTLCYCDRDLTVDEIKTIVGKMRDDEGTKSRALFTWENCPLDSSDKTYEKLTEELNKAMKKYHINTCIRRIHFLAQSYHESGRYGTTLEGASGKGYNPGEHSDSKSMEHTEDGDGPRYKGRGIIQLTWRKTQKKYFTYILENEPDLLENKTIDELFDRGNLYKEKYIYYKDKLDEKGNTIINPKTKKPVKEKVVEEVDVDSAGLIARNIHFAFDSAGWYWENLGKTVPTGENINEVADKDNVLKVSQCINGKVANPYGLKERKTFTKSLKKIFEYEEKCVNRIKE